MSFKQRIDTPVPVLGKLCRNNARTFQHTGSIIMPSTTWRLIVSFLIPSVGGYAMTVGMTLFNNPLAAGGGRGGSSYEISLCYIAVWLMMVVGFVALWYKPVQWSSGRRIGTGVALIISIAFGALAGYLNNKQFTSGMPAGTFAQARMLQFSIATAVPVSFLVFAIGCAIAWRESTAEAALRIQRTWIGAVYCPVCKYEMTGQSHLTCGECGNTYTLGQWVANMAEGRSAPSTHQRITGEPNPTQRSQQPNPPSRETPTGIKPLEQIT